MGPDVLMVVDDCHSALEDNRPLLLPLGPRCPSKEGLYSVNIFTFSFSLSDLTDNG